MARRTACFILVPLKIITNTFTFLLDMPITVIILSTHIRVIAQQFSKREYHPFKTMQTILFAQPQNDAYRNGSMGGGRKSGTGGGCRPSTKVY